MRGEINSNRYEISFCLKILLRCSISSLLVSTLIEIRQNSKWHEFYIGHFEQNEISSRHGVFMWTKSYPKRNEYAETCWILCLMRMCVWNSLRVWILYRLLWISFRVIKYHVNTTRNEIPTHVHQKIGSFWNAAEMKRHVNRLVFTTVWNLRPVWVHFTSHEKVL